jgi:hypothetical protein
VVSLGQVTSGLSGAAFRKSGFFCLILQARAPHRFTPRDFANLPLGALGRSSSKKFLVVTSGFGKWRGRSRSGTSRGSLLARGTLNATGRSTLRMASAPIWLGFFDINRSRRTRRLLKTAKAHR